jgi:hypothetical protein
MARALDSRSDGPIENIERAGRMSPRDLQNPMYNAGLTVRIASRVGIPKRLNLAAGLCLPARN